jgi:acyl-CoA oxidase
MKLFPIVAIMWAHSFTGEIISTKFKQLMEDIKIQNYKGLDVLHHYCAGMKSVYTQDVTDNLYIIRQSLGGAGYSAWSGIPRIIEDYSPNVTFEGDNTVMAQ